eukprot:254727-Chlamydomonas_euryale.AAC.15
MKGRVLARLARCSHRPCATPAPMCGLRRGLGWVQTRAFQAPRGCRVARGAASYPTHSRHE